MPLARGLTALTSDGNNRLLVVCMLLMVFAATPLRAQSYTDLRDFDCSTGCTPYDGGRLTQGADGYLYGTTGYGGTANKGTIFKVNTAGTSYNVVWNFDGTNSGELPTAALTLATDGNFYGTTAGGGTSNYGTLFSFNPKTLALNVLHDFSSAESSSDAPPIEATNKVLHGVLYGTTQSGEVYTFNLKTQTFQPLPYKTPGDPNASLVQASDGYLYGVSQVGGKDNAGTIFRVSLAGKVKILYAFTAGTDGASPTGPLVEGKGGLFGTTYYAGSSTHDAGVVFMLALPSLQFTTLHIFVGTDGSRPAAGLKAATDGSFYGTTAYGGANGVGTIFQITPSGTFTIPDHAERDIHPSLRFYGDGRLSERQRSGDHAHGGHQRHSLWAHNLRRRQRDGRGRRRLLQPYPSRHYS